MDDASYANMPETRRKAVILWEMLERPMGEDGIRIIHEAIEHSTDEQVLNTLKHLSK